MRRVVITGPPCSGKSTFIQSYQDPGAFKLPEVASLLMTHCGLHPRVHEMSFQACQYSVQRDLEVAAMHHANALGKTHIVQDRGCLDAASFLAGGLRDLRRIINLPLNAVYSLYERVVFLPLPPREVFERHSTNNPARHHTYEESRDNEHRLRAVWQGHPKFILLGKSYASWEAKRDDIQRSIHA